MSATYLSLCENLFFWTSLAVVPTVTTVPPLQSWTWVTFCDPTRPTQNVTRLDPPNLFTIWTRPDPTHKRRHAPRQNTRIKQHRVSERQKLKVIQ